MKKRHMSPARLIALGFLLIILLGTGILMLPIASKTTPATLTEALFTATSATCVTGLIVRDTFTGWTTFGQVVILSLIQLGGLGFMTVITMVSRTLGRHLGLYDRKVLMQSAGNLSLAGISSLVRRIIPLSFAFELAGAALFATRFVPEFGWGRGLWFALFHSISAFCNAGFDLMGAREQFSSLTAYVTDPVVNLTAVALVVIGGLGFIVWRDLGQNGFRWKKYMLHTKLVLVSTAALLLGGWVLFLIFEWNASMTDLTVPQKVLASLFQSMSPRTAGFNTVDLNALSESGNALTNVFMLIGGSPGSTAGGIKTTTIVTLLLSAWASTKGYTRVNVFHHSIDRETIREASSILLSYLLMAICAVLLLCAVEPITLKTAMFEVNSAIATVGLTLGATPSLSIAGRLIIILLMYVGRIGGMTFLLTFAERKSEPPVDRPTGKLLIG